MRVELLNYILAFIEGLVLIISPCILPVLPIILSGSIGGGKERPLGIILGFITIFVLLILFSHQLVVISGIDLNILRKISFVLLVLLGIIIFSNYLTEKFDLLTQRLANVGSSWKIFNQKNNGFISGILFGSLIGIIWTPCAGPILAAIILQAALQKTNFSSFITALCFGIGVAIPMLVITIFGRQVITKLSFIREHPVFLRKVLGCIIVAGATYMYFGPSIITAFITNANASTQNFRKNMLINNLNKPYAMPQINGISAWINSGPIQPSQLKNQVVLVDFWAYSCINCVRSIPHLNSWYKKYHDKGLVIIGIHSPEFEFEKSLRNVKAAVVNLGIKYPVALDNNFTTWQNYNNSYWPSFYLIDKNGKVVYRYFSEGAYNVTENNIRFLLGLDAAPM